MYHTYTVTVAWHCTNVYKKKNTFNAQRGIKRTILVLYCLKQYIITIKIKIVIIMTIEFNVELYIINHLKMEKDKGMKIINRHKTLEQGRFVCYTGLAGHRDRHV